MKYFFSQLVLFIILTLPVAAQDYDWARHDSLVKAGIDQIYGIQFEKAENTFDAVIKEYPTHPSGKFFKAMITWWRILLKLEDESLDDEFMEQLEEVIEICDRILEKNKNNKDALFFKGGAIGFRGRLLGIREKWLKAALDGKEGLELLYRFYKADPQNPDVQFGFGIYHYYAEVIPEKFPAVKPLMIFFPNGDREKGLSELEYVALKGRYARIESRYFLMTLNFQFEENMDETRKWASILLADYPNNPNFQKYYGLTFVKENRYDKASEIFRDIYSKCVTGMPGYNSYYKREASYYVGLNYKNTNNVDSAIYYFTVSEKLSRKLDKDKESGFLINTVLYLGMLYDLKGDRQQAIKYYRETLTMRERSNSHKLAEQYLKKPYGK
ncbi:tetratricopeptide domain-containing protein [Melioribacter roseus P3M-2]|uniref:Tetratricopeptide domain-containing protein n=1 Tax=Melioribacter roseus (strain DSM 23840 / JCM 17771 / VKM B-2668 / P3M-2) TaxID=1191523 RepID=I6Z6Q9_MELRP|nr:tetratricopeptide repeat protein [Melioribacter roseus]AFN74850.1 tetratricopeptide domain-containing protein [Melioribacter roseus P3M-2]